MKTTTLLAGILLTLSSQLFAQEGGTGSIRGKVFDAVTQEPLIGANVLLVDTEIGAATDLEGNFLIERIPPGTYQVRISSIGYKPRIQTDVVVANARQVELRIGLESTAVELDEVVVEAEYFIETSDNPTSTQTLSYEEIRRAPGGFEDVVRAVAVLPGVAQPMSGRNDLIVRGGAPSENLYVVDNLEVPNINHFGTQGATGGPLSFINVDFVRDVTFSTGGFGVRYGDKLSSVMRLKLKDGRTDRIGGKATISATQFGLNTEGPLPGNGSFIFSARRSYLDFIFKAADFGFVPEYWDFLLGTDHNIDKNNEVKFLFIGALDNVNFFNDTEDKRFENSRVLGNAQDQYFSSVSWRHLFGSGFMTFTLGRTYVDYSFLQSDSLLNPIFQSDSREGETSLRADGVFVIGDSRELSFGARGKYVKTLGEYVFPVAADTGLGFAPEAGAWDTTAYKFSAYAQLKQGIFDDLSVIVGGRLDYFNLLDNPAAFSPRGAISYDFSQATSVTLSGGIYRQAPSYVWLTSNPINTRLEHIRVDQLVLGVDHLLRSDLRVRVEGYIKEYSDYPASTTRDYLVLANTGAGFGGGEEDFASFGFDPLVSDGMGIARGVEFLVQKRLSDIPVYGVLSVSINETEFTALDGVERPGAFDQRLILNLSGGYVFDGGWEASAKFRYGTGMPYTGFLADGSRDFANYNGERLPDFHALDVRVDKRWNFESWNLITFIDIQNIYNRENIQGYRWDVRNNKVESTGGSIGILPSIGVSAEF
ncbi:MAG: TonB-dependent receptor [Ectothiorhodospiraceae bacterium]|nr:TonB-dependent receptor [Ectothiorhodospiraceae bacterium]